MPATSKPPAPTPGSGSTSPSDAAGALANKRLQTDSLLRSATLRATSLLSLQLNRETFGARLTTRIEGSGSLAGLARGSGSPKATTPVLSEPRSCSRHTPLPRAKAFPQAHRRSSSRGATDFLVGTTPHAASLRVIVPPLVPGGAEQGAGADGSAQRHVRAIWYLCPRSNATPSCWAAAQLQDVEQTQA